MNLNVDGARLLRDLKELSTIGNVGKGGSRLALSEEDMAARRWLRDRMEQAGLDASIDGIGNVFGYTPGAERYLLIGSHTDTVPMGGWLDGALGVMTGLEIARAFMAAGAPGPVGIGVVSFSDEEGTIVSLLGSRVFGGSLTWDEVAQAKGADGRTLAEARAAAGLADAEIARIDPQRHAGYIEIHIEQGPVLESEGRAVGIVTEIVGIRRARATFHGRADHAGTTPMAARSDAAQAMFAFATAFRDFVQTHGGPNTVFNLGGAKIAPGAFNVVPERAELLVEYRSPSLEALDRIEAAMPELAQVAAAQARATGSVVLAGGEPSAAMAPSMIGHLTRAAQRLQLSSRTMPSGAGHDAMSMASQIPAGMLFVPSIGGRSHTPEEDTAPDDIVAGLRVMAEATGTILEEFAAGK
ncbi:M20 family metallo-hydrolase [Rhodoligotrophos defluvii]|uniref:M20 family metallo-hydrolase n=1 Tax=Rhodoligotrophos defluvii TaxID=2561934 RepID=UPI0010C9FDAF|nr:M20 family metallo-hydrolase [Rhodoligotrophos defluvii]